MSHVYSFAFISFFVYLIRKIFIEQKYLYLYLLAVIFAVIILIRPFNALVLLLLPMWSGSFSEFLQKLGR